MTPEQKRESRVNELMSRCARCRWPLAKSADDGCVAGSCSMRQLPELDDLGVLREEIHRLRGEPNTARGDDPDYISPGAHERLVGVMAGEYRLVSRKLWERIAAFFDSDTIDPAEWAKLYKHITDEAHGYTTTRSDVTHPRQRDGGTR